MKTICPVQFLPLKGLSSIILSGIELSPINNLFLPLSADYGSSDLQNISPNSAYYSSQYD